MHRQKKHFRHQEISKSGQGQQKSLNANFQKVYFLATMHSKGILNILGGQNLINVTKGYQVQVFKKIHF